MAAARNMMTLAEGVETSEQRESLPALGCKEMQGFLFSRPVPAAGILRLLLPSKKAA